VANTSGSFKTGEKVLFDGEYECLDCRQLGKATVKRLTEGSIFPYCDVCEAKDCTYKLRGEQPGR
jgi:hypothetical protein